VSSVENFFRKKKGWSLIKDQIFDYYLTPYIAKILTTRKPLIIIDCFAGKGKFDDQAIGSPLIIAQHIERILSDEGRLNRNISAIFIESKYYKELEDNLSGYRNCSVWAGTFEDNLSKVLEMNSSNNVFVYVDPYGIKSLDFKRFISIKEKNFNTLEMLVNFNSFGFLREGCRLLKCDRLLGNLIADSDYEIDEANNISKMDRIANGNYWQQIIEDFQDRKINMTQAEERFSKKYIKQIESLFKYVVTIPIKQKTHHLPKYRLIFGTDSPDGLILMADNMHKKWKQIVENERAGQAVLFDYDYPDPTIVGEIDLEHEILTILNSTKSELLLKGLLVRLIQKYGIAFSERHYINTVISMQKKDLIQIRRDPEKTPTGRLSRSMNYNDIQIWVSI